MPEENRKQVTKDFQKFQESFLAGDLDPETERKAASYFWKKEKTANDLRGNLQTARRARNSAEKRQQKIEDEMSDIDVHLNEMRGNLKNKENQLKEIKNLYTQLQKFKANTWDKKHTELENAKKNRENIFQSLGIGEQIDPSEAEDSARQQLDTAKEAAKQKNSNKHLNQVHQADVKVKEARFNAIKEENSKVNKAQAEFDKVNTELNKKMSAVLQGIANLPFGNQLFSRNQNEVPSQQGSNEPRSMEIILQTLSDEDEVQNTKLTEEELDKALAFMNEAISTLEQEIESMNIDISWGNESAEDLLNKHVTQENTRNEAEKKIREI